MSILEEARAANRRSPRRVRVIAPIADRDNYFGREVAVGTMLTVFRGATYGCVSPEGVAVTLSEDPYEGPFAELKHCYYETVPLVSG